MEFHVIEETDTFTHVALSGRLDMSGVKQVQADFDAHTGARGKPAIIDLAGVSFLGSLGMRMLLGAAKALRGTNAKVAVVNPQEFVADALKVAGLDQALPIAGDADEARRIVLAD